MSNPELRPSRENSPEQGVESSEDRKKLEQELLNVESEIQALKGDHDKLQEDFTAANNAEYSARLQWQKEKSAHPESHDLTLLEDAQKANKALADRYQEKLDNWDKEGGQKYYQLQRRKEELEAQLRS